MSLENEMKKEYSTICQQLLDLRMAREEPCFHSDVASGRSIMRSCLLRSKAEFSCVVVGVGEDFIARA